MADSTSSINSPHLEDSISQSQSHENPSVGYFPHEDEDTAYEEDIIPWDDLTPGDSSCHSLPPVKGPWGTESVGGPMEARPKIQKNPENLVQEAITEDLDASLGCDGEDSGGDQAQSEEAQSMDKCPQEQINQTYWELDDPLTDESASLDNQREDKDDDSVLTDFPQADDQQPSRNLSSLLDQVSEEEFEACQNLPNYKTPENGDIQQFPEKPPRAEEDEIVELESEETGTTENPPVSSEQSKEQKEPTDEETTCCVNFRRLLCWIRKRVVSILPRRNHPASAKEGSLRLALERGHLFGGNEVLPEVSI